MDFFNGHLGSESLDESDEMRKTWAEQDCINNELEKILLLGEVWQLSSPMSKTKY